MHIYPDQVDKCQLQRPSVTNMLAVNDETPIKLNEISEVVLLRKENS